MSETCSNCAKIAFNHPCSKHAECMILSGKGKPGGLKWDPTQCDLFMTWLSDFRKDKSSEVQLITVLKLARNHTLHLLI